MTSVQINNWTAVTLFQWSTKRQKMRISQKPLHLPGCSKWELLSPFHTCIVIHTVRILSSGAACVNTWIQSSWLNNPTSRWASCVNTVGESSQKCTEHWVGILMNIVYLEEQKDPTEKNKIFSSWRDEEIWEFLVVQDQAKIVQQILETEKERVQERSVFAPSSPSPHSNHPECLQHVRTWCNVVMQRISRWVLHVWTLWWGETSDLWRPSESICERSFSVPISTYFHWRFSLSKFCPLLHVADSSRIMYYVYNMY